MTVSASIRKAGPFTGNGAQTAFPFTFKVFTTADIQVITAVTATGVETTLVLDSDYSVALNADQDASPGGTITYPISGTALPASKTLTAIGALEYKQGTDVPSGGDFNADSLENALDYQNILIQQLVESDSRSVKVSANSTTDPADLVADLLAAEIAAGASASAAAISAAAAAAGYDAFDDRYLGSFAANPTLDNDGNALITGALYFNTVVPEMRVYSGTAWQPVGSTVNGTSRRGVLIATAGQTVFPVAGGYDPGYIDVYLNGAKLVNGTDATVTSGTDIVLASGATVGDTVDYVAFGTFAVADAVAKNGDTMTGLLILSGNAANVLGAVPKQQAESIAATAAAAVATPDATDTTKGKVELATVAEAQTGTDTARAVTPAGLAGRFVAGTAVASTSGTATDFTSIPSWVKRITITLSGVSTNGTSTLMVQLGDSGGIETTGYLGGHLQGASGGAAALAGLTTGLALGVPTAASMTLRGVATLVLHNTATNTWCYRAITSDSTNDRDFTSSGDKSLSATLDRVRITTVSGVDTFDAGSINILYE